MILKNLSRNIDIATSLTEAKSFKQKALGLIGTKSMTRDKALWFKPCNWIHTFFMSMSIDVIYLDKQMVVKKVELKLKPWRFAAPVLGAHSVIEFSSGSLRPDLVQKGDQLDVGH